jgi:outer membrane protein assembly factor BamD (BamD/ComL family)
MNPIILKFVRSAGSLLLVISLCGFSSGPLSDIETAIIQKDFKKAETMSQDIIANQPQNKDINSAYYFLGLSQMGSEKYDEARETFNVLITRKPGQPMLEKAYLGVIDSYLLTQDYRNALTVSEALLRLSPKSEFLSLIYLKLARANLKLAQWETARDYLNKIVKEFPQSLEYHLAKQLLEEKQYFAVQVGSFLDRERAEHLSEQLKQKGEYAYIIETTDPQGRKFYRVRIGQFSDLQQAQGLEQKLSNLGYPTHIYP